jgi:hypothetical protein
MTYALYHPAAALRQGSLKETMLADVAGVPEALLQARSRRAAADAPAQPVVTEAEMEIEAVAALEAEPASPEPVLGLI